jgi:hypothetical protein
MTHGIGHEHREHEKRCRIEDELRDEYRPQQWMMQHEYRTLLDVLQRMASGCCFTGRLVDSRQQHHGDHRKCGGKSERRRRAHPSHQHAAQGRSAGKGDGARQFDPCIGRR